MIKPSATAMSEALALHPVAEVKCLRRDSLRVALDRTVAPGALLAILFVFLATQNLLLWRFTNFAPAWLYLLAVCGVAGLVVFVAKPASTLPPWPGPTVRTLLLLGAASIVIFLFGGEGRIFYANVDWQVRDAVLHDLRVQPWPFVYQSDEQALLLRAPIGMFLIPALIGKVLGPAAADGALLIQNSLLLTLLLALGSTLFAVVQGRWRILLVIVAFSGMDILARLLDSTMTGQALPDHLEQWGFLQFSSHITQAFWVPQHALAGWTGALLFLLWHHRRLTVGQFYAFVPMLMLLSPLGVMGTLPFAAYAGCATLLARRLKGSDFLSSAAALLLSLPSIIYLGAGSDSVGLHLLKLSLEEYLFFETIEALPFLLAIAMLNRSNGRELAVLLIVALCLFIAPFFQLGEGMDFTMRVSIPALALLSVQAGRSLYATPVTGTAREPARILLIAALLFGSVTGIFEIVRAIVNRASPRINCSLEAVWNNTVGLPPGNSNATYVIPVGVVPPLIRPKDPFVVRPESYPVCWDRPWMERRFNAN